MTHTARVYRPKNLQKWVKMIFFGFFEGGAFALFPPTGSATVCRFDCIGRYGPLSAVDGYIVL